MIDDRTEIRVSSLEGNHQFLDGGAMFGNVPKALWGKWCQADEQGRIELACRALLIEFEGRRILCEAGIGLYMNPELRDRYGVLGLNHDLISSLQEIGLSPDDIDIVVLSHLHFDHVGGILKKYEELTAPESALTKNDIIFQNAKFVIGEEAFERSLHPHPRDRASFIPGLSTLLKDEFDLELVSRERASSKLCGPRLQFIFTDGHTPGQMHTLVNGSHRNIFFSGDLIPGQQWVHLPVTMGYDRFAELVIDEKKKIYEKSQDWLFFFTHDCTTAAAEIIKNEKGKYHAVNPQRILRRLVL